jgi:hypothetical protein
LVGACLTLALEPNCAPANNLVSQALMWTDKESRSILIAERWTEPGTTEARDHRRGIPQGSPLSPLLANLYMRRFVLGWKKLGLSEVSALAWSPMPTTS